MTRASSATDRLLRSAELAREAGRLEEAERIARQAQAVDPDAPGPYLLLGRLALTGNKGKAAAAFGDALARDPDSVEALNWLAMLRRGEGAILESIELSRRAVALRPDDPDGLSNLGLGLLASGEAGEAVLAFERAVTLSPELAALHHNLGHALERLGRDSEAGTHYRRAIELAPEAANSLLSLAELLLRHSVVDEAIELARRVLALRPNSVPGRLLLARALTEARRPEEAEALLRQAVVLTPQAGVTYGFWLHEAGRFDEAKEQFEAAIAHEPRQGQPYYGLVQGRKVTEADRPLLARMEETLRRGGLALRETAYLHYGLGKALDDLAEYGPAMRHFDGANAAAFGLHFGAGGFDAEAYAKRVDETITAFPFCEAAEGGDALPVLIVGMIRSGTTLVEQILSSHPEVGAAGELRFWLEEGPATVDAHNEAWLSRLRREYLGLLRAVTPGKRRVTDKMPLNYRWVGLAHRALPNARFIHVRRNPADTCLSIWATPYRNPPDFAYDRDHIVFAYRQYQRLMAHWREAIPADRLFEVDYEELVLDRERVVREMIAFVGLTWEDACLRHDANRRAVQTPSLWQARQPIYKTSMERWRHYEPWLGAFRELVD